MNLRSLLDRYSVDQLKQAIRLRTTYGRVEVLEGKRSALLKKVAKIDRQLSKLNGGNGSATISKPGRKTGRRKGFKLSAATRNRMRIAALKRYGKLKGEAPGAGKRKRKPLSPETKAKMAIAARKRWAKIKGNALGA